MRCSIISDRISGLVEGGLVFNGEPYLGKEFL
jgi:hypothetical protein